MLREPTPPQPLHVPTYEYRCPNGHEFEEFFRTISSAQAELKCPTCGAIAERRVSGGAGLLFKGSGFYITDYGKDGKKNQQGAAPKKDSGGGESTSSSAEPSTTRDTSAKDTKDARDKDTRDTRDTKAKGKKDE